MQIKYYTEENKGSSLKDIEIQPLVDKRFVTPQKGRLKNR